MSSPSREAGTSNRVGRPVRRRLAGSHLLIGVVVIAAFVLNVIALQDRSSTTLVAIAKEPISAGSTFSESMIELVPVSSDFEGLASLLTESDLDSFDGWVFQRSVSADGVLDRSALIEPAGPSGLRSMSIPVPVEHAAGGALSIGDRVDVISVVDGVARFVAVDVGVVGVSSADSGSFGSIGGYHVVLAVEPGEALALATAVDAGSIEVVRSTGAAEIEGGPADGP